MTNVNEVIVVYDDECPFCKNYCKLLRIRRTVASITLIDARKPSAIMAEITSLGLDVDQGMVVKFKDKIYYGSEAICILSCMSTRSNLFNHINFLIFGSKKVSKMLYPFLRNCRNLALWVLNIPKINNLKNKETP